MSKTGILHGRNVGGIALLLCLVCWALMPGAAQAAGWEVTEFDGVVKKADGSASTQAGEHPASATTVLRLPLSEQVDAEFGLFSPVGSVKDVVVQLPAGFVGNPLSAYRCRQGELMDFGSGNVEGEFIENKGCPASSIVGMITVEYGGRAVEVLPLYNVQPSAGTPAMLAFQPSGQTVYGTASLRTGGDYGINFEFKNVSAALGMNANDVELWGVPSDPSHDADRGASSSLPPVPFLRNPTSCSGPVATTLRVNSWQEPANVATASFLSHDTSVPPVPVGNSGCERVPFNPTIEVAPTSSAAASPAGLSVDVHIPQTQNAKGIAQADLKKAVVTLPRGMTVNASSASGQTACTNAQIDLGGAGPANCPDASKIGTVAIHSPLIDHPVEGGVFLAKQVKTSSARCWRPTSRSTIPKRASS